MVVKRIIFLVLAIQLFSVYTTYAQRDYTKDILVFFKEGVKREARQAQGEFVMRAEIQSDRFEVLPVC